MKQYYLVIILLFIFKGNSQTLSKSDIYSTLLQNKTRLLNDYKCAGDDAQAVLDTVFRSQFRSIFSSLILNSNDVVSNGSAFSYSIDDEKTKVSANFSFFLSKRNNHMLDIGLNIANKKSVFNFYDKDGFAQDIGLKVAYVIPISKNTQYFDEQSCEDLKIKRKIEMDKKLLSYKTLLQKDLTELRLKKSTLERNITDQTAQFSNNDINDYNTELIKTNEDIKNLETLLSKDSNELEKVIVKDIAAFDIANNPFTGYKAKWINLVANFDNNNPKISNDSIIDVTITEKTKMIFKYYFEVSGNAQWNTKRHLIYAQINARLNNKSLLDNPFLKEKTIKVSPIIEQIDNVDTVTGYNILADDNIYANYNQIEDSQLNYDFGLLFSWFGIFKKTFGLSYKGNFNFPTGTNLEFSYQNNYTSLLGFNFRMIKEATAFSKATFSLNCGFENVPTNVNAWDFFLVKIAVGVPFSIFSPK